jgi:septum formation protein
MRLVLASASPRRAELLRAAGFTFDTIVTDVDESVRPGESASAYVRRLAAEKSAAAQKHVVSGFRRTVNRGADGGGPPEGGRHVPDTIILGADTAVVVDGDILGKPRDDEGAAAMLRRLSGRRHDVMTGLSLRQGAYELGRVEITAVFFSVLSDTDVAWYVAGGEGRDKAGAYAIQGLAARFIPRIEGSYANVVGLPVACVVELLTQIRQPGFTMP